MPPGGVVVVTLSAAAFREAFDAEPQFEIVDSDPAVPLSLIHISEPTRPY